MADDKTPGGIQAEDSYLFLPFDEAANPKASGLFRHYVDYWWIVHPVKGLAFLNLKDRAGNRRSRGLGAAQCNSDRRIGDYASRHLEWAFEVRQIPSAWVPADTSDYRSLDD